MRAVERRVAAAVNYGFGTVVVPPGTRSLLPPALAPHAHEVQNVAQLRKLLLPGSAPRPSKAKGTSRSRSRSVAKAAAASLAQEG